MVEVIKIATWAKVLVVAYNYSGIGGTLAEGRLAHGTAKKWYCVMVLS